MEEDPQKKNPGICIEHTYMNKRNMPRMENFKFEENPV